MPAYHSKLNKLADVRIISKMALLPLKTAVKGPAPPGNPDEPDILDEVIETWRANILFRNFEVKGPADLVLIYFTVYLSQCLNKIRNKSQEEAKKICFALSLENFKLPGEAGFPLGGMVSAPANRADADTLKNYLTQARQELGVRLCDHVYRGTDNKQPSKWWMQFSKLKFMDLELK
uniref:Actin-related protein 2/3 complex subunit 3 n=1 Tax=Arcella intermedia TaxID=1963864 RepID=A0A6B2LL30_9EUKA